MAQYEKLELSGRIATATFLRTTDNKVIIQVSSPLKERSAEREAEVEAYANLLVASSNGCISANPQNPKAVAYEIENMIKALAAMLDAEFSNDAKKSMAAHNASVQVVHRLEKLN